ncbi:peptidoglycan DD-metalloendopeptidase family protein [Xylanimonas sp. McL0601]|uniref:peptidoglycan DD-metalloendopeptidase family protein n=1 Tax=Xylanimonas sp. McL0601 TaxID=3414739 RepID=UPI003CF43F2A
MRTAQAGSGTGGVVRAVVAALLAVALGLGAAASATADDIDDRRAAAEQNAKQKKAERAQLLVDLDETNAKLAKAVLDLNTVEGRLPLAQAELARAQAELEKARREAEILAQRLQDAKDQEASVTAQIQAGAGKVDTARADIAQMAREAARGQGEVSALGLVTGAQSTEDFLQNYAVTSSAARSQARTLTQLQDAEAVARNQEARLQAIRETITQLKKAADANVVEAKKAEKEAADRKAEVEALVVQQKHLKAEIEAQKVAAQQEIEENEADQKALQAEIKTIIKEQKDRDARIAEMRRKAEDEARRKAAAAAAAAARNGGSNAGSSGGGGGGGGQAAPPTTSTFLGWPTAVPYVTSSYGWRFHPVLHYWRLHAGTDFRAYCGTPIYAAQSGFVVKEFYGSGPGNNVLIDHGSHNGQNVMTRYLHLSQFSVHAGQWVNKGQQVGLSGATGTVTACHLHFEVYINGSTVDPMTRLP